MRKILLLAFLLASQARAGVDLVATGDDNIDWGDADSVLHGLTTVSVAISFKPSAMVDSSRLLQAFSGTAGFIIRDPGSAEMGIIFLTTGGYRGFYTDAANISTGSWHRLVFTVDLNAAQGGGNDTTYYDGIEWTIGSGISPDVGTNVGSLVADEMLPLQVGFDGNAPFDGVDGCYAEIAIWSSVLSSTDATALSEDASPEDYPTNRIFYWKGINTSDLDDVDVPLMGTLTDGANCADHPVSYGGGAAVPVIHQQVGFTPAANYDEFLFSVNAR